MGKMKAKVNHYADGNGNPSNTFYLEVNTNKMLYHDFTVEKYTGSSQLQPLYLYFTVTTTPKVGELCLYLNTYGDFLFIEPFDKGEIHDYNLCRKLVGTSNLKYKDLLPKPNQSFIKEYIERGGIDEVTIEMTNRCCGRCDSVHDSCWTDTQCESHLRFGCEICFGLSGDVVVTNDDNEMSLIYKIKGNWNADEVKQIAYEIGLWAIDIERIRAIETLLGTNKKPSEVIFKEKFDEWCKQNIK